MFPLKVWISKDPSAENQMHSGKVVLCPCAGKLHVINCIVWCSNAPPQDRKETKATIPMTEHSLKPDFEDPID